MHHCPCCSQTLIRQIRQHQVSWFCRGCWQDMPLLDQVVPHSHVVSSTVAIPSLHKALAKALTGV